MQILYKHTQNRKSRNAPNSFYEATVPNPDKPITFMNVSAKSLSTVAKLIPAVTNKGKAQGQAGLFQESMWIDY